MRKVVLNESLNPERLKKILDLRSLEPTQLKIYGHFSITDLPAGNGARYIEIPGVTLVFDLAGSSASIRRTSPKNFVDTYAQMFDALTSVIYANQGIIEKFPGDGISAHFLCLPHELQATANKLSGAQERAARAAININSAMIRLNFGSAYRISMWSGADTIATEIGNAHHKEIISVGNGVNVAHKLEKEVKSKHCKVGMDEGIFNQYNKISATTPQRYSLPEELRSSTDSVWYGV